MRRNCRSTRSRPTETSSPDNNHALLKYSIKVETQVPEAIVWNTVSYVLLRRQRNFEATGTIRDVVPLMIGTDNPPPGTNGRFAPTALLSEPTRRDVESTTVETVGAEPQNPTPNPRYSIGTRARDTQNNPTTSLRLGFYCTCLDSNLKTYSTKNVQPEITHL